MLALPLPPLAGVLLLAVSLLLLVLEFNRPGLIVPGALGLFGLLLVLASLAHAAEPVFHIATFCMAAALTAALFRRPNITLGVLAALALEAVFHQISQPDRSIWMRFLASALGLGIGILNIALARIAQRARINKGHTR